MRKLLGYSISVALGLAIAFTRIVPTGVIAAHRLYSRQVAPSRAQRYLQAHTLRKLQLGAGGYDPGDWLNTDVEPNAGEVYLDATKPFPLPDRSLHYIFSEHMIEHLTYSDGLDMLRECHRVLVPGGRVRIATPDLAKFAQLFQSPKTSAAQRYMELKNPIHLSPTAWSLECMILNEELTSFGHRFVYDRFTLTQSLILAGFQEVKEFAPGQSDTPVFRGIERRFNDPRYREQNDYEAMDLEAVAH